MITERIAKLEKECAERGKNMPRTHFEVDYHASASGQFANCPQWELTARSMAYAIENMDVFVCDDDRIGGRIYHNREMKVEVPCPALDYMTEAAKTFAEKYPEAPELIANQLIGTVARGHITWFFDRILSLGTKGLRDRYEEALQNAKDEKAEEFYKGVIILIDALQTFNDKHIEAYENLGNHALAERMRKVPRYPAETFEEAVQSFFMQHIVVMRENPFGGNGPGRLDYYLWPYLERDIKKGICTLEKAKEIIDELFLRIDERLYNRDMWVEAIVVGGTYPNGCSAVNPLTYIMVQSIIDLDITHPSVYVRLPENPPDDLVRLCAEYMMSGRNRAQILYDPPILSALVQRGTPYRDAVEYACGGCMEVGIQGMTSDFLYIGWHNAPKMLELMVTGGICLRTGNKVNGFKADKGLAAYSDFESFYSDFIKECDRLTKMFLEEQDVYSALAERNRPSYLISSMLDDCLARGRNMHGGGVRYHDYGGTHLGLPNVCDGLFAIKTAVFDEKFCTASELVEAMKANFEGYEILQARLRAIPKYGVDNDKVDAFASRVMGDFCDMYRTFHTRWDGRGKPVILTFTYSPQAAAILGATPDGRPLDSFVAQGITPQSCAMTEGITAAINSCSKIQFEKFSGGASSMWDFDRSWATEAIIEAVIRAFIMKGCQIFQGNTTSVEELIEAQKNPEEHKNLIVRVGGYSARFVSLNKKLQDDVISRIRHSR